MSFDFVNNGNFRNTGNSGFGAPVPNSAVLNGFGIPTGNNVVNGQEIIQQQQPINYNFPNNGRNVQPQQQRQFIDPRLYDTPEIVTNNSTFKFSVKDDPNQTTSSDIHVDEQVIPDAKRRGRPPKKDLPATQGTSSPIVRPESKATPVNGVLDGAPTAYTYMETTAMLHSTLNQIDAVSSELMGEFEMVRANRAMKNKYGILNGLSENIGALISNKIQAIKEINNSISKSNDLDYKRYKDNKDALNQTDDKYISDLYTSFLSNQNSNNQMMNNMPRMDAGIYGSSGIVRADIGSQQNLGNIQYTNYIANVTPEERLMLMEGNNNVKQCMVYDPATGNRAFQYFDFSNPSNPVPQPGLPTYSDILLNEFTIDLANRKAKSTNLKETMDLIIVGGQGNTY